MLRLLFLLLLPMGAAKLVHHPVLEFARRRLEEDPDSWSTLLKHSNITRMRTCMDQRQYSMFRDMMAVSQCSSGLFDSFGGGAAPADSPSGGETETSSFLSSGLLDMETLVQVVQTTPFEDLLQLLARPLCESVLPSMLPCLYVLAPEIAEMIQCLDPGSAWTAEAVMDLADDVLNLGCAWNDARRLPCGAVFYFDLFEASPAMPTCESLGCCQAHLPTLEELQARVGLDTVEMQQQLPTCSSTSMCPSIIKNDFATRPSAEEMEVAAAQKLAGRTAGPLAGPEVDGLDGPQGVHLSLPDGSGTGMVVMWMTGEDHRDVSMVEYGTDPSALTQSSSRDQAAVSYNRLDTVESNEATQWMPMEHSDLVTYHHTVTLRDLVPGETYYYRCHSGGIKSEVFQFKTPNPTAAYQVAIFGDMGLYESAPTLALLEERKSELAFIYHIGDIAYADNDLMHNLMSFEYENIWNRFMHSIQNVSATTPYMVLPGNHEAECHSPLVCMQDESIMRAFGNFSAYNHRFHMPETGVKNMWYSFHLGPVVFIAIDTETDFKNAPNPTYLGHPMQQFGDQEKWLEDQLKEAHANRATRPFVIVLGHRPLYSGRSTPNKDLQRWLEPLFEKYSVDLYVSGHIHHYERHAPVYKEQAEILRSGSTKKFIRNARHTQYIVHGAGGNEETITGGINHDVSKDAAWTVKSDYSQLGLGLLTVYNKTTIKWEYHGASSKSSVDEVTIDVSNKVYNDPNKNPVDNTGDSSGGSTMVRSGPSAFLRVAVTVILVVLSRGS